MLKKVLIALAAILVVGVGVAAYTWNQATALPEWYQEGAGAPLMLEPGSAPSVAESRPMGDDLAPLVWSVVDEGGSAAKGHEARAEPGPGKGSSRNKRQVRNFHLERTAKNPVIQKSIRASNASYQDGKLEAGVVINLSGVEQNDFGNAKDRDSFERATKAFPVLKKKSVYIGLEDQPVFDDQGYMQLGSNPRVRIGNLEYSLSRAARRLGTSESKVRQQINGELKRLKVRDPDAG